MLTYFETTRSSAFSHITYDKGYMDVFFRNGTVYSYWQIPASTWNWLEKTASVGSFYNEYIKGVYQYKRIQ